MSEALEADANLAEIARLRAELAQAHERAQIASEAYNQQQSSYRELEGLYTAMTERAQASEAEAEHWRRQYAIEEAAAEPLLQIAYAAYKLSDEIAEFGAPVSDSSLGTLDAALIRVFGGVDCDWLNVGGNIRQQLDAGPGSPGASALAELARLTRALRRAEADNAALLDALERVDANPFGCPMCSSGRLLNPAKEHWPDCGFMRMQALLSASHPGADLLTTLALIRGTLRDDPAGAERILAMILEGTKG